MLLLFLFLLLLFRSRLALKRQRTLPVTRYIGFLYATLHAMHVVANDFSFLSCFPFSSLYPRFGMNLDMGLLSLITGGLSVFGLPWLVAATVRSLAHVKSLTNYEQLGGGKEAITGIVEQRQVRYMMLCLLSETEDPNDERCALFC